MPGPDPSQITCFLYDPEPGVRRLLRDAIAGCGLRQVETFARIDALGAAIGAEAPDLLVADAAGPADQSLSLIYRMRHGLVGANPFPGVIVTAFNPTRQLVQRVTNSGADALLVKPVAPRSLRERISALMEAPRTFVVTSDYIGPDRRRTPRAGNPAPMVNVPNTMHLKASGLAREPDLRALIEDASAQVNELRIARLAFRVAFLIEFARPGLAARPPDGLCVDHLLRVPAVVRDLIRRLPADAPDRDPPIAERARRLTGEVERIAARIRAGEGGGGTASIVPELGELGRLALDLMAGIEPGRDRPQMADEVDAAVNAYRIRLETSARQRRGDAVVA
ncbi:MAG TPA: hypothetical protein VK943_09570 [Arenibaculum sp.]|nr:hypothetical protein [Arenibaculum sp.]